MAFVVKTLSFFVFRLLTLGTGVKPTGVFVVFAFDFWCLVAFVFRTRTVFVLVFMPVLVVCVLVTVLVELFISQ